VGPERQTTGSLVALRYPSVRADTTKAILERCFAICPELAPPSVRAAREPTVEDLRPLVIEEGCGLRPARKDGVRLELEWFELESKRRVPVVYNYGHGGFGFQSSWGSASKALELLEGALAKGNAPV